MNKKVLVLLGVGLVFSCGGAREIRVEKDGVVVARTALGPQKVKGGLVFRVVPPAGTYSLTVAGDFNQWDPTTTPLTNNPARRVWMGFAPLAHKGKIRFKFIRNGSDWLTDPVLDSEDDGYGGKNSVFDTESAPK